jgi:drug/metabolite transporter (DMT)-like permease
MIERRSGLISPRSAPLEGIQGIVVDTRAAIWLIVGLGLLGTVGASSVTYLPPVVAMLIAVLLVGEPINLLDWAAAALILGGVLLLHRPKPSTRIG